MIIALTLTVLYENGSGWGWFAFGLALPLLLADIVILTMVIFRKWESSGRNKYLIAATYLLLTRMAIAVVAISSQDSESKYILSLLLLLPVAGFLLQDRKKLG